MVCACSMDKSSIKFWLLFDLKPYIVSCSGCTKSNIGGCKKGIDPADSVGTMAALFQRPFTAPAAYQILAWWLSD